MSELTWDAPGPGVWFCAREHVPTPVSRLYFELLTTASSGWRTDAERYGTSAGEPAWGWVNGWMYYGPRGVDDETLARREAAAAETLATQRWHDDVRRWHDELRPAIVATNRALQAEAPSAMGDDALADHLDRALDHAFASFPVHFDLKNAFSIGGGAAFEALEARGMTRAEIAAHLSGGSPGSARARALIDAIVEEIGDRDITSIDDLRGHALDAYLGEFGCRGLGRDELRAANLVERPDLVVASVRARRAGAGGTVQPTETGDPLLDELRALYGLNDDHGGITGSWPMGIVRRAALEVGRRVGTSEPNDVFESSREELRALARGGGPSVDELRARAAHRELAASAEPPPMFGDPSTLAPSGPLPPSIGRVEALSATLWAGMPRRDEPLHGVGVGTETYRGRACVIDGDGVLDVEPGDVLVAFVTGSAHNTVFPIAGAVATQEGGLLSHPAVLARELGLPAVVGVRGLLDRVKTGDIVEIDPAAGMVRIIQQ